MAPLRPRPRSHWHRLGIATSIDEDRLNEAAFWLGTLGLLNLLLEQHGAVSEAVLAYSNWMHKHRESFGSCQSSLRAPANGPSQYWLLVRDQLRTS